MPPMMFPDHIVGLASRNESDVGDSHAMLLSPVSRRYGRAPDESPQRSPTDSLQAASRICPEPLWPLGSSLKLRIQRAEDEVQQKRSE